MSLPRRVGPGEGSFIRGLTRRCEGFRPTAVRRDRRGGPIARPDGRRVAPPRRPASRRDRSVKAGDIRHGEDAEASRRRRKTAVGARPTPPGDVATAEAAGRLTSRRRPCDGSPGPPAPLDPATDPPPATPPPASGASSHPWRKWLLWAGAVAVLAVGGYALTPTVKTMMKTVSTDDAYVNGHVTFVAPRVAGQVSRVLVDDNDRVSKGDVLVQLDREPYQVQVDLKKAAVVNAEADVDAARAQVRGILAQARSQRWKLQRAIEDVDDKVAQLKARVAALRGKEATRDLAKADFARPGSFSTGRDPPRGARPRRHGRAVGRGRGQGGARRGPPGAGRPRPRPAPRGEGPDGRPRRPQPDVLRGQPGVE